MTKDVEMKDASAESAPDVVQTKETSPLEKLQSSLELLERAVRIKDTRLLMGRLLRQTGSIRYQLDANIIRQFMVKIIPEDHPCRANILPKLGRSGSMDVDKATSSEVLPEVEMYVYLISLLHLINQKDYKQAKALSEQAVQRLQEFNRRTLDVIAARIYFYYSLSNEKCGTLQDIRSSLLAAHQTSCLRHDEIGQETILNLLLANYLHYNLYDQAERLRAKAQRPEQSRQSQQYCRYLYYLGRIRAIRLEYSEAKECLQQAARKAPSTALGFRVEVNRWVIIIRLLLGEIPERMDFSQPQMSSGLQPYFELTQAVRTGDVKSFRLVQEKYAADFKKHKTFNLIERLHHNVIRIGLRRISLAYSRVSLKDVASKLGLGDTSDIEWIVAKAIRDGGIDAVIDHKGGYVQSKEVADIYSTVEPLNAYHARVAFCIDIHNEAVKAMRFEPDAHKKSELEDAEARKERLAQEQELAKAVAEDPDAF